MDNPAAPLLRVKQLVALRAVTGTTGGLRIAAHPSAMLPSMQKALVEDRSVLIGDTDG
jgi:hypothetical protein